jgi:hypothetical protein
MIVINERTFLQRRKLYRPFSYTAEVTSRSYSLPLQRVITDFGSDVAFNMISNKLSEHYGIEVPESSAQKITEKHAEKIKEKEDLHGHVPKRIGEGYLICQTDGTMIPIVETCEKDEEGKFVDKRKTRSVRWKEGRLTLARQKGRKDYVFGGTLGSADAAGDQWFYCAIRAGLGEQTKVHCVGDGAPWIVDQVDRVFGKKTGYLIDFYHLCDYLASASKQCSKDPEKWLEQQKERMKEGLVNKVLQSLWPHIEPLSLKDIDAPVRRCYRYINNRLDQFDYKSAIENDLPIGSGEIESAHRYVIQDRLKLSGAWWKVNNAENMLALRIFRENNEWNGYWENLKAA